MDDWDKFNETSLPEKEDFYSHLNMEDITDADYVHAKRFCNLRTLEICAFKYMRFFLQNFYSAPGLA